MDSSSNVEGSTEEMSSSSQDQGTTATASSSSASAAVAAPPTALGDPELDLEARVSLMLSVGEECITEEELRALVQHKIFKGLETVAYDGFEPSGRMHIAQGVMKAINVNKLTRCGCTFKFWVADWFAMLNNKMDGDLKKIRTVGQYMIEIWTALGMDMTKVKFLWSSDEINGKASEYWPLVMDIARKNNLKRIKRCCQIMGREESDDLSAAQIFYPAMQCADIFFLKADICQLGMDQRKVNMLAREYCDAIKKKFKPIILSHPMLPGLLQGQEKMSKSDPNSAIFMEDSEQEVKTKIKKAYCPPNEIQGNPCIAYVRHIVLPSQGKLVINRREEDGGPITYTDIESLENDFKQGTLHPGDLKPAIAAAINQILEPVREHFRTNQEAKALLEKVKKLKVTK